MVDYYAPNRACYCDRCRCRSLMGPVVLITLGVLFLLSEFTSWHFHHTWPILLIAIGVVKILGSSASDAGHVAPYPQAVPPAAPPPPVPTQTTPPPQEGSHV